MLDFLEQQRQDVLEELKELYIQRRNAGPGSIGDIENRIRNLKKELERLEQEISESKRNMPSDSATQIAPEGPNSSDDIEEAGMPREQILSLIEHNEFKEAIELMEPYSKGHNLILITSRVNRIQSQKTMGIISDSQYDMEINKITYSLLKILDDL